MRPNRERLQGIETDVESLVRSGLIKSESEGLVAHFARTCFDYLMSKQFGRGPSAGEILVERSLLEKRNRIPGPVLEVAQMIAFKAVVQNLMESQEPPS